MAERTLSVRILNGDSITNRGKWALTGYETLVIVKEGAKAAFPPYGVNKPWEDYLRFHDGLYNIDIGAKPCLHRIESPFPLAITDREVVLDPTKMSEADLKTRFDSLSAWMHESFALIGTLDMPIKAKAIVQAAKFLDIPEISIPKAEESDSDEEKELTSADRLRLKTMTPAQRQAFRDKQVKAREGKAAKKKVKEDAREARGKPRKKVNLFTPEEEWRVAIRKGLFDGYVPAATAGGNSKRYVRKKKTLKGFQRFNVERVEIDTFEQRFNTQTGGYYLYNPYSGECISDVEVSDRRISTWMLPDPHVTSRDNHKDKNVVMHTLFGEWYESTHHKRMWERGKYARDPHQAAVVLTAVGRGFLQRRRLRHLHNKTYHRVYDEHHECCYFLHLSTQETSWYKPRLAHPFSIQPPPIDTRSDAVDAGAGPLYKKNIKAGTENIPRVALESGKSEEPPPATEREPDVPDLESDYLYLSMWMDDNVKKVHKLSGMYRAYETWDWTSMLRFMLVYVDDPLVQMYALHAIVRMDVVMAGNGLSKTKVDQSCRKMMNYLFYCVSAWGKSHKFGSNRSLSLHHALGHIFKNHYCRVEFFYGYESRLFEVAVSKQSAENKKAGRLEVSLDDIEDLLVEDLDDVSHKEIQQRADTGLVEHLIEEKMKVFTKILKNIPVEITKEQHEKGIYGNVTDVARPTQRAAELVTIIFKIMGVLAHERDPRESIGCVCGPVVTETLRMCCEEPYVVQFGLRCLYNFMYMCFEGWRWTHMECDCVNLIKEIQVGPLNGDDVCQRECRRVELSLETDGWRGKVEQQIEREMKETDIAIYLAKKDNPDISLIKERELTEEEKRQKRKEDRAKRRIQKENMRKGKKSGFQSILHDGANVLQRENEDKEGLSDEDSLASSVASLEVFETPVDKGSHTKPDQART